jgi:hypothetical protein
MSGRVAAIDALESNPDLVYVGAATGGVWRSQNGGLTWKPVFDDQKVAAIGAVAIFHDPNRVGGRAKQSRTDVRRQRHLQMDGGKRATRWAREDRRIHRIITRPRSNIVWVAAMGQAWGQNADRGVFGQPGGKTWTKVLYVNTDRRRRSGH